MTDDVATDRFLHTLRCNVCPNQSLAESDAPFAADLRAVIREKLTAGQAPEQVRSFLIERYGAYISYDPPFTGETALLWLGPLLAVGFLVRHLHRRVLRRRA